MTAQFQIELACGDKIDVTIAYTVAKGQVVEYEVADLRNNGVKEQDSEEINTLVDAWFTAHEDELPKNDACFPTG